MKHIVVPADVPQKMSTLFQENYAKITAHTDRLFLFSCDHKIEHLHDDFDPEFSATSQEATHPEHFFQIAAQGRVGALATQLELIARYGMQYKSINYIAKLNSKTNLIAPEQQDPYSAPLWHVDDVIRLKADTNLSLCGIGVTIYPGSEYEDAMLSFAAHQIFEAHQQGLVAIAWMYPRGTAVHQENDPHLIAGVAGMANALGADFVKIKTPFTPSYQTSLQALAQCVAAAGNTKVITSGGPLIPITQFLTLVYDQLHTGTTAGAAVGRNIFQHPVPYAINITKALAALIYDNAPLAKALNHIR
jgi:DhnA family fructose-bisphosphate aldolase class Ia